ncbi:MMPL family transporter [Lysinimonas soli]|uniref:MMPL family transporter n=1 Tax=Lysinimonas soli TaxID=1074233 RepID=A0ABW0NRT1_9MICO
MTRGPLGRLGGAVGRHPFIAIACWAVIVAVALATAVAGLGGQTVFQRLQGQAPSVDGEASKADAILSGGGQSTQSFTLLVHGVDLADGRLSAVANRLGTTLAALPDTSYLNPLAAPVLPGGAHPAAIASSFASDDKGVLFTTTVSGRHGGDPDPDTVDRAQAALEHAANEIRADVPSATALVGGSSLLVHSLLKVSQNDLERGEAVALPIALVIMLLVFGGFLAAGIPLLGAIVSIVGAFGALFGITYLMDIDSTVINVVTAVGLGLSIDYGLLVVSRFREEYRTALAAMGEPWHLAASDRRDIRLLAIAHTADRAGRTVLFSGTTFAIASIGLLVFEPRIVRAIGVGALSVTVIAIATALTLVPALLALTGDRLLRPGALTHIPGVGRLVSRFGDVAPAEGFFSRLTRRVQKHPALITLICVGALVAVGSPLFTLQLANTSIDAIPSSSTQYRFTEQLSRHFPDATSPRVELVTATQGDAKTWATRVSAMPHVDSVGAPAQRGNGWAAVVRVAPATGIDVVREIRADRPDFPARVTGTDARTADLSDSLVRSAPWAILIIALGTILLLFLMTGSLIVPLKALVASALSLGASIGVLVWGFEQGNFAGVLHFDASHVHGVDVLVLVLTFAFGFGLAMDYEMFILSRIKEQVDAGVEAREAIARGLQRSGRIITSAALIIIVVFAGFATGDLMVIKQLGTALAVAVLLDATLVRCLLVPAFMTWQQRIMWWAPRWMKRLHARIGFSD